MVLAQINNTLMKLTHMPSRALLPIINFEELRIAIICHGKKPSSRIIGFRSRKLNELFLIDAFIIELI